jgi:hypothetical protein
MQVIERWMQSKYLADIICSPGAAPVRQDGLAGAADLDDVCLTTEALRMVTSPRQPVPCFCCSVLLFLNVLNHACTSLTK